MEYKETMTMILHRVNVDPQVTATQILKFLRDTKPTVLEDLRHNHFKSSILDLKNYTQNITDKYRSYLKMKSESTGVAVMFLRTHSSIINFLNTY